MSPKNPLSRLGIPVPDLGSDVASAIKLTAVAKPRAYLSCKKCKRWWTGGESAIEAAAAHVALYRGSRHQVLMTWAASAVIETRAIR